MAWYDVFRGGSKGKGQVVTRHEGGNGMTGPNDVWSGLSMTSVGADKALSVAAVFACVKVIREAISSLSMNVYVDGPKGKTKATKHKAHILLKSQPNMRNSWTELINLWISDYLLHGNGYLVISRDKFASPTHVHYVKASDVTPVIVDGMAYYRIRSTVYEYSDVMHLRDLWKDDLKGVSKISQHAYTLGKIQSVNEMQNKNYTNGMIIGGVVEYPVDVEMDPEQIEQVEAIFKRKYTSGKPEIAFLGGGGKFSQFKPSMSFTDAAIIADIGLTKVDICSIFTVPPHKIGILDKSSYSSFKQLQIDFQTGAILPIVRLMEEQLKKLLKQSEQATHYVKKEIDSMLRADPIESVALIAQAITSGLLSVNEGREILDRNPVDGGDKYYIPTNNLTPINEDIKK